MPHTEYAQVEITTNGYTDTVYESCGYDNCNNKILAALGVGAERFTDQDTFNLSTGNNSVTVVLRHHLDEQDSCTWCFGCGDFLVHGLSCDCEERGHSPEEGREPMEPMVDIIGKLELRAFQGK